MTDSWPLPSGHGRARHGHDGQGMSYRLFASRGTRLLAAPAVGGLSAMDGMIGSQDWRAGRIREWLLLLLRFAITRDAKDEAAAFAVADEIDALGLRWRPSAPSFFRRTNKDICKAITTLDDPNRSTILKRHIARIDDPRLRRAFEAAVGLEQESLPASSKKNRRHLGPGLRG
jgi:hypothetical protein